MQILMLEHMGWIPNNPNLPVLVYLNAIASQHIDLASQFEAAFSTNGWPPQWRNGVYGYHLELQRRLSGVLCLPGGTARGHLSRGTKQVATG